MGFETAIKKAVQQVASISGIGATFTFHKVSAGTYNTSSGEIKDSTTDTSMKGVFEDITQEEVNDLVEADDRKLIIAAQNFSTPPTTADRVTFNGSVHQIIKVKTQDQAGVSITYELVLRA